MLLSRLSKITSVLIFSVVLTGCAGSVAMSTPESARVTTGAYDGVWEVNVLKSAGLQYVSGWQLSCGDMRHTFQIEVTDGAITLDNGKTARTAYVSNSGRFKMNFPIDHEASASVNSGTTMANGDMKIILRGKLDESKSVGFLTYGIAEFGYGGCTAKTRFKYLGKQADDLSV